MNSQFQPDGVEFWSDSCMPYVETRRACESRACYKSHSHSTFSIGAVDEGRSIFSSAFAGTQAIEVGALVLIPEHVEHACNPVEGQAWSYQMMHLDASWMKQLLYETEQDYLGIPKFKPKIYKDANMYQDFCRLNNQLFSPRLELIYKIAFKREMTCSHCARSATRARRTWFSPGLPCSVSRDK